MRFFNPVRLCFMAFLTLLAAGCATGPINDVACPNSTEFRRPVNPEESVADLVAQKERGAVSGSY